MIKHLKDFLKSSKIFYSKITTFKITPPLVLLFTPKTWDILLIVHSLNSYIQQINIIVGIGKKKIQIWLFIIPTAKPSSNLLLYCYICITVTLQASLFMEFSRQEYWSRLPFPTPGSFLSQGSNPRLLCLLLWQVNSLSLSHLQSHSLPLSLQYCSCFHFQAVYFT